MPPGVVIVLDQVFLLSLVVGHPLLNKPLLLFGYLLLMLGHYLLKYLPCCCWIV